MQGKPRHSALIPSDDRVDRVYGNSEPFYGNLVTPGADPREAVPIQLHCSRERCPMTDAVSTASAMLS